MVCRKPGKNKQPRGVYFSHGIKAIDGEGDETQAGNDNRW
jgi:hypothetical protein